MSGCCRVVGGGGLRAVQTGACVTAGARKHTGCPRCRGLKTSCTLVEEHTLRCEMWHMREEDSQEKEDLHVLLLGSPGSRRPGPMAGK